jgi:hypothetical protein
VRRKSMRSLLIIAILSAMVTGCATSKPTIFESPISGTKWEGTVVSKPYSIPRTKIVSDIIKNVKGADDEYSMQIVNSIIDKEISPSTETVLFADNSDCQSKIDYLFLQITPFVNELPRSVNYILKDNSATGTKLHPSINYTVSTEKLVDGLFLQHLSSDMFWRWENGRGVRGFATINVGIKVSCEDQNKALFKVDIPDYIINNPTLIFFSEKVAELSVDWVRVRRSMDSIEKEYVSRDGMSEYKNFVNRVSGNINSKLADRFLMRDRKKAKNEERIYKIALDVMSSRIQRKLEEYKFMTDKTRYEFSDKMDYRSTSVKLKTIVKVFPEEGGKTSVVFSLEYTPIYDTFTEKITFGENEAQKYLLGQIGTFEKLIASL